MAVSKFENLWQIMRNYESVTEIQHDMLCLLCKNLLLNARCVPCGCRFCFSCISGFLDGGNKICPGFTEECKLEILNLDKNIYVDQPMNIKISRLKVKCPEKSCEFVDELRKMEDHSRMCKYRSAACPYSNIGCDKCNISQDKVSDHLQSEILAHTKLLMNFVGNFNNEMEMLKANNNGLSAVIELLRNEINDLKLDGERRREEIAELQVNIICLNGENVAMRENVDKLISDGERNQVEIGDLQRKCADQVEEIKLLNLEMPTSRKNLTEISNKIDKSMDNVDRKLLEMAANQNQRINGEFVWKLDKFTDKMADAKNGINAIIYSESFLTHKNGFKMCLCVYPDGFSDGKGTHLPVYFHLMKGEFDGILEWPFRHSVTFALINQRTRLPHVSKTVKCANNPNNEAFIQPTDRNTGWGFHQFVSHEELLSNPDLMRNNQIFIKCSVDIDS